MGLTSPGFSVYLTLGYPKPNIFPQLIESLSPYVDFFELGIPTQKPKYDGPTIRATHSKVVSEGVRGLKSLKILEKAHVRKTFTLMAYLEDHMKNLRTFLEEAACTGARCVLFPDLAFDFPNMLEDYVDASERAGLKPCFFASSRFPHDWFKYYASFKPLYIYLGLQPATGVKLPISVERNVELARKLIRSEYLLAGFAVRTPEVAVALIHAGADAVVVGSAIIRAFERGSVTEAAELARRIYRAVHDLEGS